MIVVLEVYGNRWLFFYFIFPLKRYTTANSAVYAIVLEWPDSNSLSLGSVKTSSTTTATMLGYGKVDFQNSNGVVQVTFPNLPLDTPLMWAWVIKFEGVTG